jgi:glucokinase
MDALIGIDVGATSIAGGLVTPEGEVLAVEQRRTHARGKGTAVEVLLELVDAMVAQARTRGLRVLGVGAGLAGVVDADGGTMAKESPRNHLREFAGVPLAARIASETGLPAFVDNDANALALAEWTFGVAQGASSMVLLAVGTEIGGAIISGGTLLRGHGGFAGELGHVPIHINGPRCICGGRGCAGAYLGGRVIARTARRRSVRSRSKLVSMAGGDRRAITSELVFEAARLDDPLARMLVDQACEAMAALVTIAVNGLNPEVVIITGGVAASLAPLSEDILRRTGRYAYAPALARTRVEVVSGEKSRTVRGGAALVLYELRRKAATSARESYNAQTRRERTMPKFVIEREIPGVGSWPAEKLKAASSKSVAVLKELGPDIQWIESYVTGDRLYCVYIAPGEELIRTHASKGGFPVTRISRVATQIDPTTAEK